MTLAELLTSIGTVISDYVADFTVYIAAGVVIALAAFVVKRLIKAGR